jgi:endonuclease-3
MPPGRDSPAAERAPLILRRLRRAYPDARIALDFSSPLECVVATILSAQSTDVGVNKVTKSLFAKYRVPEDYLAATEEELQREIHATGFFRQKTRALRALAQRLVDDFDSQVPKTMAELVSLPGIARKTANIVQGNCFPETARRDPDAGMAVDTHVGRLAVRLGLTEHNSKEAERIERDLVRLVPKRSRVNASNLFIEHGRRICLAKAPRCEDCVIESLCPSSQEAGLNDLYRAPRAGARITPTMVE